MQELDKGLNISLSGPDADRALQTGPEGVYNLAQSRNLEGLNVWFTTHFVGYLDAQDQVDFEQHFLTALQRQQRTAVFDAVCGLRRGTLRSTW